MAFSTRRFAAKKFVSAILIATLFATAPAMSFAANAGQCKDPKSHKFIKCPPAPVVAPKPTQCLDAKGKFTKCTNAPVKPKQCRDAKGRFMKCH